MESKRIVVKRVKKIHGGHHGGSWKVAFADFATAMMAFFLVLWLTTNGTPEQKRAVEGYFRDPIGFEDGGSPNPVDLEGSASVIESSSADEAPNTLRIQEDRITEMADVIEQRKMQQLLQEFKEKIDQSETLSKYKDQLLLDITEEGLRIQIVDRSQRPMFDSGSAQLKYYSQDILFELAKLLRSAGRKLSITGHTDASPFGGRPGYTNWELSADRANSARRAMAAGGVDADQIARVVGLADAVLFEVNDPLAPVNRRIAIIVLNKKAEADIRQKARKSAGDQTLIDATAPTEAEQSAAEDLLKSGDWSKPKPAPTSEDLNW